MKNGMNLVLRIFYNNGSLLWIELKLLFNRKPQFRFLFSQVLLNEDTYAHMHCSFQFPLDEPGSDESETRRRRKVCNKRLTWRQPLSFQAKLCRNLRPKEYLKSLYWFIDQVPLHVARKQAGVSEKQWRGLSYNLRKLMRDDIERQGAGVKLGGRGKVVCVDETFFTKKRRTRGGFQGNPFSRDTDHHSGNG